VFTGIHATPPTRRHLRHWERVCRYLDAQPYRSVRYPFPLDPPMTTRLFKRMARFGLVRHREDCSWRLSRRWMGILRRLWEGTPDNDGEDVEQLAASAERAPFIAATNVDTLYISLFGRALPADLVAVCTQYKARAQEADEPVETPWRAFDAPLSMWKAGVGTSRKGRGVSWSFLLRNAYLMIRLRRSPLQELIGSVRFSAESLWTYGPRAVLDGARECLATMWGAEEWESFGWVRWQLAQLHLCADVANLAPEPVDLERFVTRARKKAIYIPSLIDLTGAYAADDGDNLDDYLLGVPEDWADLPAAFLAENAPWATTWEGEDTQDPDAGTGEDDHGGQGEETPVDEEGSAVYLWGRRASGFAFAQGAPLSAAVYDKALEARRSGKRWMEAIHRAGGWTPEMPLFRVEGRFTREVFREMAAGLGLERGDWCDNPWKALDHLRDFWGYFVGLPPEHDHAPDATHRGWLRLAMPSAKDDNCSRWPTDPAWEVVQRARFIQDSLPMPLQRAHRVMHDLGQIDAELYGLFKLRSVICARQHTMSLTLSTELRAFATRMEELDEEHGRDYYDEVREKARMLGQAVPARAVMPLGGTSSPA
jgi:hypothetical protein